MLKALSARVVSGSRARCVVEMELGEGKNREVRRLFESQNLTVKKAAADTDWKNQAG